jgi:hypothetical protein
VADSWFTCALAEHDAAAAATALVALGENTFGVDAVQFSRSFGEGLIARIVKSDAKARSAFAAARAEQEKRVQGQANYGPAVCVLGVIDAGLGRKEEALSEGRRAVELLPVTKDSINGAHMIEYLAVNCGVGRRERSRMRTARDRNGASWQHQLWPIETAAVLGSAARRSAFRENRRLARTERSG